MKKKAPGFNSTGWQFLGLVLLGYAVGGLIDWEATERALNLFASILMRMLPLFGLIFLLLLASNLLLTPGRIRRYLGRDSGLKGWVLVMVSGIVSIGSLYAWYPLLQDMQKKGGRPALIVTFLYCRAIKLPLLPLMIHYFGWAFSLLLSLYIMVFSVFSGILVERLTPPWRGLPPEPAAGPQSRELSGGG